MRNKKIHRLKSISVLAITCAIVIGFQNCDQSRLALMTELASAKSDGEICAIEPTVQASYTKLLFVVDKSGSNVMNPGTDATGMYRVGTISAFYDLHRTNQFTKWGLVSFQGAGATPEIFDDTGLSGGFSNDPTIIMPAVQSLAANNNGGTPYQAAIAAAASTITNDIARNPNERSKYVVVFISDGEPSDGVTEPVLENVVTRLTALGDITLSTVYYGPVNLTATDRMQKMANWGKGKFLDTNVSGRIPLDSLLGFNTGEPWLIKNFTVTNLNASPCDDGTIDSDSDADGLCDKDETRYNAEFLADPAKINRMQGKRFDPLNRNSFDPYLSDAIFYKYIVFSENLPRDCTPADLRDDDKDLANKCEERYLFSTSPTGPTQEWTAQMQNDGDAYNFDSDGDGYLDFFEFLMTRNKSAAMDRNNVNQLYLGQRLDTIYNKHLNWRNPFASVAYDGAFQFRRVNEKGQNCYSYNQSVMPLYKTKATNTSQVSGMANLAHVADENVVMISFIQVPERDPNGAGELRYTFQKISAASNVIKLNLRVEEYQSYRVGADARVTK